MNRINEALANAMINSRKVSKQRQFGLLLTIAALVLVGYSLYQNGWQLNTNTLIFTGLAIIFATITFVICKFYFPFLLVWLVIGNILGLISSFIILLIIYFIIISPVSLIKRIFEKNKRPENAWITKRNVIDYKKLY